MFEIWRIVNIPSLVKSFDNIKMIGWGMNDDWTSDPSGCINYKRISIQDNRILWNVGQITAKGCPHKQCLPSWIRQHARSLVTQSPSKSKIAGFDWFKSDSHPIQNCRARVLWNEAEISAQETKSRMKRVDAQFTPSIAPECCHFPSRIPSWHFRSRLKEIGLAQEVVTAIETHGVARPYLSWLSL